MEIHEEQIFGLVRAPKKICYYRTLIVKTKRIQIPNTVEFLHVKYDNPMLNKEEKISLLLQDLITIVSSPTQTIPSLSYSYKLNNILRTIQDLMCKNKDSTQHFGDSIGNGTHNKRENKNLGTVKEKNYT